jgi:hypothetical protein
MLCFDLAFGRGGFVKKGKCKTNYCRYAELATRDVRIFIARTILCWIHGKISTIFWTGLYIFSKSHCNVGGVDAFLVERSFRNAFNASNAPPNFNPKMHGSSSEAGNVAVTWTPSCPIQCIPVVLLPFRQFIRAKTRRSTRTWPEKGLAPPFLPPALRRHCGLCTYRPRDGHSSPSSS